MGLKKEENTDIYLKINGRLNFLRIKVVSPRICNIVIPLLFEHNLTTRTWLSCIQMQVKVAGISKDMQFLADFWL